MANLKENDYLNKENLKMAFDFFDQDHNGSISIDELKKVFVGIKEEAIVEAVLGQTDNNNDGEVIFS